MANDSAAHASACLLRVVSALRTLSVRAAMVAGAAKRAADNTPDAAIVIVMANVLINIEDLADNVNQALYQVMDNMTFIDRRLGLGQCRPGQ